MSEMVRLLNGQQQSENQQLILKEEVLEQLRHIASNVIDVGLCDAEDDDHLWQPLDLHLICQEQLTLLNPYAQKRGITITYHAPEHRRMVYGQSSHFREMVRHLLKNAIQYSPFGQVVMSFQFGRARQDGRLPLSLTIADEGIGMTQDHLDQCLNQRSDGIGLGLVRHLCGIYQGTLNVDSSVSEGTTCTLLCFPMEHRETVTGSDQVRLLIESDVVEEAQVLANGLRHWGFDTIVSAPTTDATHADGLDEVDQTCHLVICMSDDEAFLHQWQQHRAGRPQPLLGIVLSRAPRQEFSHAIWVESPCSRQRLVDLIHRLHNQEQDSTSSIVEHLASFRS